MSQKSFHGTAAVSIVAVLLAVTAMTVVLSLPEHATEDEAIHETQDARISDTEVKLEELGVAVSDLKRDVKAVLEADPENVIVHYPKDSGKPEEDPDDHDPIDAVRK